MSDVFIKHLKKAVEEEGIDFKEFCKKYNLSENKAAKISKELGLKW